MVNSKAWTVSNGTGCMGLTAEEAVTIQSFVEIFEVVTTIERP